MMVESELLNSMITAFLGRRLSLRIVAILVDYFRSIE